MLNFLKLTLLAVLFFNVTAAFAEAIPASVELGEKQPVFLLCPHKDHYSAWSLYLMVDKNDPSKPLYLGLESLQNRNSKDESYLKVLAAQKDPKTRREELGRLSAKDFGSGNIEVRENKALEVSLSPAADGAYHLNISMRISADGRFNIGGRDADKRDVVLKYNKETRTWGACAATLVDAKGNNPLGASCLPVTGITFPVTGTGIYRVAIVDQAGNGIWLLDK